MKISEIFGELNIDASQAQRYVRTWFNEDDLITICRINSTLGGTKTPVSTTLTASQFVDHFDNEVAEHLIFDEGIAKNDFYINIFPMKNQVAPNKRGTEEDVARITGVYADLDVKEGGFSSELEIFDFLDSLSLQPSMLVTTGSGGVHAYWKLHWSETKPTKQLFDRWWAYLDEAAGEHRKIDKLIDVTRMLRLPGTVRFPKAGEPNRIASVALLKANSNSYSVDEILEASEASYGIKLANRLKLRQRESDSRASSEDLAKNLIIRNGNPWTTWQVISQLEDFVNSNISWDDILIPHGWSLVNGNGDSRSWARPGRNVRSATTDFECSAVMSLFSAAEETGLSDLLDAGVHLTKYRVMLRLRFGDNQEAMVEHLFDSILNKR